MDVDDWATTLNNHGHVDAIMLDYSVEVGIRLSGKVHGIFIFCPRYRD